MGWRSVGADRSGRVRGRSRSVTLGRPPDRFAFIGAGGISSPVSSADLATVDAVGLQPAGLCSRADATRPSRIPHRVRPGGGPAATIQPGAPCGNGHAEPAVERVAAAQAVRAQRAAATGSGPADAADAALLRLSARETAADVEPAGAAVANTAATPARRLYAFEPTGPPASDAPEHRTRALSAIRVCSPEPPATSITTGTTDLLVHGRWRQPVAIEPDSRRPTDSNAGCQRGATELRASGFTSTPAGD